MQEYQNNYMWEEYELTRHAALALRDETYTDLGALKKLIAAIKDEIRGLATSMSMRSRIIRRCRSGTNF